MTILQKNHPKKISFYKNNFVINIICLSYPWNEMEGK